MNLDDLYAILAAAARAGRQLTYMELSRRYHQRTGDWVEPHGGWDEPLGELNRILNGAGWPPLSAVVVLQDGREPGGRFWESSPNVPVRPRNDLNRIAAYSGILNEVYAAPWPDAFPVAPPTGG